MWTLFCFPGRIIAEIGFLFPKRGQLWASARRRESAFTHFLFSIVFWTIAAFFLYSYLNPTKQNVPRGERHVEDAAMQFSGAGGAATTQPGVPDTSSGRSSPVIGAAGSGDKPRQDADALNAKDSEQRDTTATTPNMADISSDPQVILAGRKAFEAGEPVRWKSSGVTGYATPSVPSSDGCRMVRYSIDGNSADQYPAFKVCQ